MFRFPNFGKKILALLLPVSFFMGWATCEAFCAEIAEQQLHHQYQREKQISGGENQLADEDCANFSNLPDSCQITAAAAVVEARQTVKTAPLFLSPLGLTEFRAAAFARLPAAPEVRQNSPPILTSAPLFLRLCTLRI